jgi:hypothetical protein
MRQSLRRSLKILTVASALSMALGCSSPSSPAVGSWKRVAAAPFSSRILDLTVWTGSSLLTWGGSGPCGYSVTCGDGGMYAPENDQWQTVGTSPLAEARAEHQGVWTGAQVLIWGGTCGVRQDKACEGGAAYSPSTDEWASLGKGGLEPTSRKRHTALWTGAQMLVWGGEGAAGNALNDGGSYAVDTGAWSPIATSGAPSGRRYHSAIWTGTEMVIWGGDDRPAFFHALGDGGRYDPVTNHWRALATQGAPSARYLHTVIWTGSEMIVWGGLGCGSEDGGPPLPCGDGARYNPLTDSWSSLSSTNAPQARAGHSTVWTGSEMIVWGGTGGGAGFFGDGALYSPETNSWRPMADVGAPSPRNIHRGLWTGDRMLVWGGLGGGGGESALNDGGQFFPTKEK